MFLGLGVASCASAPTPADGLFQPDWLFDAHALDELPDRLEPAELEDSSPDIPIPSSFVIQRRAIDGDRAELDLIHRASRTAVLARIEPATFPSDNTELIKSMLAFMHEGFERIEARRQLRVELLPPLGAASTASMDGRVVDGLLWWRPTGMRIGVKVTQKMARGPTRSVLLQDLQQLLVELDAAVHLPKGAPGGSHSSAGSPILAP